ncbi:hypothetical protein FNF29_01202 [Cafeteria roenbergensis]|uniref:PAS domain-containing protein n=1 Tax=Cafeteria roenbergensis TaxID=33653 RepID=A0A5A8CW40_CAFRO|nr:hypothetical protein FNF29_01202 [Cafeteria roenbergensis]|eukprot:KAA0156410.1 hypothetical protein FNF29_01202 [Cafeteria roenbergensis]
MGCISSKSGAAVRDQPAAPAQPAPFHKLSRTRTMEGAKPLGVFCADAEGLIRFANATMLEMTGHTSSTLLGQHVEILLPMSFRRAHRKMYREYLDRYDRVASAWIPSPIMNRPRKLRIAVRDGGFRDITFTLTDCLVQLGGLGGGVLPVLADSSMPPKTAGNATSSSATPVASEADAAGGGAPGGRAMPPAQVRFIGIIQEISDAAVQGDDGDSTAQGSCTFMPPEHAAAKSSAPAAPAGPPGAKGWKVESSAGCPAGKGKPKSRGKSHQDAKATCPHMAGKH